MGTEVEPGFDDRLQKEAPQLAIQVSGGYDLARWRRPRVGGPGGLPVAGSGELRPGRRRGSGVGPAGLGRRPRGVPRACRGGGSRAARRGRGRLDARLPRRAGRPERAALGGRAACRASCRRPRRRPSASRSSTQRALRSGAADPGVRGGRGALGSRRSGGRSPPGRARLHPSAAVPRTAGCPPTPPAPTPHALLLRRRPRSRRPDRRHLDRGRAGRPPARAPAPGRAGAGRGGARRGPYGVRRDVRGPRSTSVRRRARRRDPRSRVDDGAAGRARPRSGPLARRGAARRRHGRTASGARGPRRGPGVRSA